MAVTAALVVGVSGALIAPPAAPAVVTRPPAPHRPLGQVRLASYTPPNDAANPDYGWATTNQDQGGVVSGDLVPFNAVTGAVGSDVNVIPDLLSAYSSSNPLMLKPAMSPNGHSLFFDVYAAGNQPLFVYDTGAGTVTQVSGLPNDSYTPNSWNVDDYEYPQVMFSPNGTTALVVVPGTASANDEIYTINLSSPTSVASSVSLGSSLDGSQSLALSQDGTTLYAVVSPTSGTEQIEAFSVATGSEITSSPFPISISSTVSAGLAVDTLRGNAYVVENDATCGSFCVRIKLDAYSLSTGSEGFSQQVDEEQWGGFAPAVDETTGLVSLTEPADSWTYFVPPANPSGYTVEHAGGVYGAAPFTPDGYTAATPRANYGFTFSALGGGSYVQTITLTNANAEATDVSFLPFATPVGGPLAWQEMLAGNGGQACGPCFAARLGMQFPGMAPPSVPASVSALRADPVDTVWGDLDEAFTDAKVASLGPPLDFTRTYSSQIAETASAAGPLGFGWSENWDASLVSVTAGGVTTVTVTEGSGAANVFQAPSGTPAACPTYGQVDPLGLSTAGSFCAAPRVTASLSETSGTYTYTLSEGESDTFNSSGQLTAVSDAAGESDTIETDTPTPGSSADCNTSFATSCETILGPGTAADRFLVLAFNATNDGGQIVKVSDSQGRHWSYGYDSHGNLTSVTDPRGYATAYGYDTGNGNTALVHDLVSVTTPTGTAPSGTAITSFCTAPSSSTAPGGAAVDCYSYDAATGFGRVMAEADPMKRVTTFNYGTGDPTNEKGGSTTVTNPAGDTVTDFYVFSQLVKEQLSPNSAGGTSTWYFARDAATLLPAEVVDPNGNTTATSYDAAGNPLVETDAGGRQWTFAYAAVSSAAPGFEVQTCAALPEAAAACSADTPPGIVAASNTTVTPPSAAPPAFTTYREFDGDGNPVYTSTGQYAPGSSSATNTSTSYALYDNGSTSQSVTIGGHAASCSAVAPARNLPCATVDPAAADTESGTNLANAVTQLGYDADGDLTSSAIPDGNSGGELAKTTWTSYNGDGQVLTEVAPLGNVSGGSAAAFTTTTSYNSDGEVAEIQQGTGSVERTWISGYDHDDNETSLENPLTGTTSTTYDAADEANLVTDADGNATLTCYDADGRVAQVVPPVGVAAGTLTGASCPTASYTTQLESDATTFAYDALGDRTTITSPAPAGRSETDETTTSSFDAAGRLLKTVAPSADPTNDPNGVVTIENYDTSGRLVASATGAGSSLAVTSYCDNPDGLRTAVVPPDGNSSATLGSDGLTLSGYTACATTTPYETSSSYQTGSTYDSAGDLLSETLPATSFSSSRVTTDTYDASAQLATSEDPNGVTDTMTYTPLGELASETYSGGSGSTPSVTNSYDANGELTQMIDGSGTSTDGYDAFGDVTSYDNGDSQTTSTTYNGLGEPTQVTYPLPSGTSWDTEPYATFTYDTAGLLQHFVDLRATETQFAYTPDELLKTVTFPSTTGTVTTTYDNADDVSEVDAAVGSTLTYSYDYQPSTAIASESDSTAAAGVSPTYNYDTLARVTKLTPGTGSATSYGYDRSGNLTTLPGGPYAGVTGTYDDASELTTIAAGTTVNVSYDADGSRLSATQSSTTLYSGTWNGADELTSYDVTAGADMSAAAYDGNGLRQSDTVGSTTNHFVWDVSGAMPRLLEDHGELYLYGPNGTPIEEMGLSGGTRKYLVADALGSVRAALSSSGSVLGTASYDAYGTPSGTGVSSNSAFGFAGGYADATGLLYLVNRYYDPATGQFVSVDPLVDVTGQPYAYVGGDPVDKTDPRGLGNCELNCLGDTSTAAIGEYGCEPLCINGPVPSYSGLGAKVEGNGGSEYGAEWASEASQELITEEAFPNNATVPGEQAKCDAIESWRYYEQKYGGQQTPLDTVYNGQKITVRLDAPVANGGILDFKDYDWGNPAYSRPFMQYKVAEKFQSQIMKYLTIDRNVTFQFSEQPPQWAINAIEEAGGRYTVAP